MHRVPCASVPTEQKTKTDPSLRKTHRVPCASVLTEQKQKRHPPRPRPLNRLIIAVRFCFWTLLCSGRFGGPAGRVPKACRRKTTPQSKTTAGHNAGRRHKAITRRALKWWGWACEAFSYY